MQKSYAAMGLVVAVCVVAVVGLYLFGGSKNPTTTSTTIGYTSSVPTTIHTTSIPNPGNVTRLEGFSGSAAAKVAQNVDNFAIGVYSKLENESGNESANLLFSPFSISAALSMATVGAGGTTRAQLESALGLSSNSTENNLGFDSVLNSILPKSAAYNLSVADGIWVEQTFPINQTFVDTLSAYYNAVATKADFKNNSSAATASINGWVAAKTNNKIRNLIPQGAIGSLTRIVLVNALHFKANWTRPFELSATYNSSFIVAATENVTVPMMHQESSMPYYSNNRLKAIELDYSRSNITMLLVLPNADDGMPALESGLSPNEISGIEANLTNQQVDLSLPRFNITTQSIPMKPLLKSLGITNAFDPLLANFSGINQTANLSISQVYHKAFIKVDEAGTEAAAATAVVMVARAIARPVQQVQEFNADHPFLFFIVDKKTGTILFMGKEANPASSS